MQFSFNRNNICLSLICLYYDNILFKPAIMVFVVWIEIVPVKIDWNSSTTYFVIHIDIYVQSDKRGKHFTKVWTVIVWVGRQAQPTLTDRLTVLLEIIGSILILWLKFFLVCFKMWLAFFSLLCTLRNKQQQLFLLYSEWTKKRQSKRFNSYSTR